MRFSPARRAFTLIEILVVLGVIVLLAALIFPVAARVREDGRRKTCQSNLNQLGLAFQQYAQDASQKMPYSSNYQNWADGGDWVTGGLVPPLVPEGSPHVPKNFSNTEKGLADGNSFQYVSGHEAFPEKGALFPYAKQTGIYTCPSASNVDKKKLSYSMNCAISSIRVAQVRTPADIVLLVDEGDTLNDGFFWAIKSPDSTDALFKGHRNGGNLLFFDGHVKFFRFDEFPAQGRVTNPDSTTNDTGLALKWRGTGSPRFHDRSFGPHGSTKRDYTGTSVPLAEQKDRCLIPPDPTRNWTTDP